MGDRQYQVLIRATPLHKWEHGMVTSSPDEAMAGIVLARTKYPQFACKVVACGMAYVEPNPDLFVLQS